MQLWRCYKCIISMWIVGFFIAFYLLFNAMPGYAQIARFSHPERIGGDFALQDQHGRPTDMKDFSGRIGLFYFGYTYCPDLCPTTLVDLSEAVDRLGDRSSEVAIVFVTVDPLRDTAAVLRDYTGMINPSITALHGPIEATAAMAAKWQASFSYIPMEDSNDYFVDHSSLTYVVDRNGRFIHAFVYGAPVDFIADELRRLLDAEGPVSP